MNHTNTYYPTKTLMAFLKDTSLLTSMTYRKICPTEIADRLRLREEQKAVSYLNETPNLLFIQDIYIDGSIIEFGEEPEEMTKVFESHVRKNSCNSVALVVSRKATNFYKKLGYKANTYLTSVDKFIMVKELL